MAPFSHLLKYTALLSAGSLLFTSCSTLKHASKSKAEPKKENSEYVQFISQPVYPKTHAVWKNDALLATTTAENSHIKINLASQRGFLMNADQIVIDYPICSGTQKRPTPKGTFYILEKVVDKRSNRYGKYFDSEGKVINSNADLVLDPLPEGARFEGADMHYWMRLTADGVGHHIGPVLRTPASHACVRGPAQTMPVVFSKVKNGTRVDIE
ncbi:MAG: L,D-transpeptidase [Verrucomicrobiota bacterium]